MLRHVDAGRGLRKYGPTPLDPPAPLVLDDDDDVEEMPTPWDALEASCSLLDEPTHRRAAAASGERTACPSPTRPTFTSQTRALMPDLRLASAALLALPQGSPAPAAPNFKSHFNAANAAQDAFWPQEDHVHVLRRPRMPRKKISSR